MRMRAHPPTSKLMTQTGPYTDQAATQDWVLAAVIWVYPKSVANKSCLSRGQRHALSPYSQQTRSLQHAAGRRPLQDPHHRNF
mmetsp:Transcript_8434/g.22560  ORF Transcript_8434/g.22560 Transcript_8434/m.22560 type:complete len:83 (+) Transcript_8434:852-1100(+)